MSAGMCEKMRKDWTWIKNISFCSMLVISIHCMKL